MVTTYNTTDNTVII